MVYVFHIHLTLPSILTSLRIIADPETAGRSLEEMDILFATDHLRVWKGEQVLAKIAAENPELYEAAKKGDIAALHASVAYAKGATEDIKDVDASGRPLSIKDETVNAKA